MDAHEREALGAAEGMQDVYGGPKPAEHAVGDTVTFQLVGWLTRKVGQIEGISTGSTAGSAEYLMRC